MKKVAVCVQTGKKHAQGNLHPIVFNILITNQIKSLNCWHDSNSKKNIFQELRLDIYQEEESERKEESSEDEEAPQQVPLRSTSDSASEAGAEKTTSTETASEKKTSEETKSEETKLEHTEESLSKRASSEKISAQEV